MTTAPDRRTAVTDMFSNFAPDYGEADTSYFTTFGAWLVDAAGVRSGDRVFEVGAGKGAVTVPAAEAVGPTGYVEATDRAAGMLTALQAEVARRGLTQVRVRAGDAQEPTSDEADFDVVLAGLVLFFLPDAGMAVDHLQRLLRPGGTLALSSFDEPDPRWSWLAEMAEYSTGWTGGKPPHEGPFVSTEALNGFLAEHGYLQVDSTIRELTTTFSSVDQWFDFSNSNGMRTIWMNTPPDRLDAAREHARRRVQERATADGSISLTTQVRLTTAQKPGR
ncbi:MAG: class I SAM-dependent methyltransferase [Jatrophihabitans sp.]